MRITSGEYRGRKLISPLNKTTHPMGDREKLALFNSVSGVIQDAKVLDLYAGSGALGLEALSRGARSVLMVESHPKAVEAIKANVRALGVNSRVEVIKSTVQRFLNEDDGGARDVRDARNARDARGVRDGRDVRDVQDARDGATNTGRFFDLILIDPPYDKFDVTEFCNVDKLLVSGGVIVLSHPEINAEKITGIFPRLNLRFTRKYAKACISIFCGD